MGEISLKGRVALVTGSGRGMGREHVLLLASRGAKVVVNDLGGAIDGSGSGDLTPAQSTVNDIKAAGGEAVPNGDDISTPEGGARAVQTAIDAFGRIDIVVCNAGIVGAKDFEDTTFEDMQRFWKVHVGGHFNVIKAAWPHMKKQKYGRVICVGSSSGLFGMAQLAGYGSAKGGVHGLARVLSHEGPAHGILVNELSPNAATRMVWDPKSPVGHNKEIVDAMAKLMPPHMVSPAVVYLASEECKENGECLLCWGGRASFNRISAPRGVIDRKLTPELIRDNLDAMKSNKDLHYAVDSGEEVNYWTTRSDWPQDDPAVPETIKA